VERVRLAQLAAGTPTYLEPGTRGHLVPRAWLATWRDFVAGASKRAAGAGPAVPPPPLATAMAEALCDCHEGAEQGLRFSPPAVAQKYVTVALVLQPGRPRSSRPSPLLLLPAVCHRKACETRSAASPASTRLCVAAAAAIVRNLLSFAAIHAATHAGNPSMRA